MERNYDLFIGKKYKGKISEIATIETIDKSTGLISIRDGDSLWIGVSSQIGENFKEIPYMCLSPSEIPEAIKRSTASIIRNAIPDTADKMIEVVDPAYCPMNELEWCSCEDSKHIPCGYDNMTPPLDCPLRAGPVTIKLKGA